MANPIDITTHIDPNPSNFQMVAPRSTAAAGQTTARKPLIIVAPDPSWPSLFTTLETRIRTALGPAALAIHHVGSTSVPGLPARAKIDIDLVVTDPADEDAYVPALEAAEFTLHFREPAFHEHRFLGCEDPVANVHVFGPDSPEVTRHLLFRDWLRGHPDDRDRYAAVKREVAAVSEEKGETGNEYGARKQWVIREILDKAFVEKGLLPSVEESGKEQEET